jgi:hypothetical protein
MITWIDIAGYIASVLVAASFYSRTMIPLRILAICSNVFFMVYGGFSHLYPVLILHVFLFPLNILRLVQVVRLIRKVREASEAEPSIEILIPHMTRLRMRKNEVLFLLGDKADAMYCVLSGSILLTDLGKTVGKGSSIGEFGIFSPVKERLSTAVCAEDSTIGKITEDKVLQLYYQNPRFAFYLLHLVASRYLEYVNEHGAAR